MGGLAPGPELTRLKLSNRNLQLEEIFVGLSLTNWCGVGYMKYNDVEILISNSTVV